MEIVETDLPGVGKKHEVALTADRTLVIVTHNTGKREVYLREGEDEDSQKLFELTDRMARTVGTLLEGAYFQPVQSESVETMLSENIYLEWFKVVDASDIAGKTIEESNVRERTGVSIVAIQRDGEVFAPPEPDDRIEAGDTVVVVGSREACADCETLLTGASHEE